MYRSIYIQTRICKVINSKQLHLCSLQPYKPDKSNLRIQVMAVIQISDRTCEQYKTEAFPRFGCIITGKMTPSKE